MFFLPFSAKHALYQLRDVTQYILALGGLAVSNPGYVVFIIYDQINLHLLNQLTTSPLCITKKRRGRVTVQLNSKP